MNYFVKILVLLALALSGAAQASQSTSGGNLTYYNGVNNGNLSLQIKLSSVFTNVISTTGTIGNVVIGPAGTVPTRVNTITLNGSLLSGGTGVSDGQKNLFISANAYYGGGNGSPNRSTGLGGVIMALAPRTTDSSSAFSLGTNLVADGATTTESDYMVMTQNGAFAFGTVSANASSAYRLRVDDLTNGLQIRAGSTSGHSPLIVQNAGGTANLFQVFGDGTASIIGSAAVAKLSVERASDGSAALVLGNNTGAGGTDKWWSMAVSSSAATQFQLNTVTSAAGGGPTPMMNVTHAGYFTLGPTASQTAVGGSVGTKTGSVSVIGNPAGNNMGGPSAGTSSTFTISPSSGNINNNAGFCIFENSSSGSNALVFVSPGATPNPMVILSQSSTTFTVSAPTSVQFQLSFNGTGSTITVTAGSGATGNIQVSCMSVGA